MSGYKPVYHFEDDKYYTPPRVAHKCIETVTNLLENEEVYDIIEPSAGAGAFSELLDCTAYDINPQGKDIIKANFLKLRIPYLKGRLVIGNPPYGHTFNLGRKFLKKSCDIGDYVAFILPISQYNNNQHTKTHKIIHSQYLGNLNYSGRHVETCFNVYKRGIINESLDISSMVEIRRMERARPFVARRFRRDIGVCSWGISAGRVCEYPGQYVSEIEVWVKQHHLKDEIISIVANTNWRSEYRLIRNGCLTVATVRDRIIKELTRKGLIGIEDWE